MRETWKDIKDFEGIYQISTLGRVKRNKRKSRKQVNQYDLNGIFIKKWNSIKEASNSLGINHANISSCCKNKYGRRSSGGFMWKYVKEVD